MLNLPPPSLSQFVDYIESDPIHTLRFLIPSILIVFYAILLKVSAARNKVDKNPDLKQEKEVFPVPKDYINLEMVHVQNSDLDYVSDIILKSSNKVNIITKQMKRDMRRYRRIKYRMTFVQSDRKRKELRERMENITQSLLKQYAEIRKSMLEISDRLLEGEK